MVRSRKASMWRNSPRPSRREAVDEYLASIRHRTERERMIDRRVTGVFSGSYAINPLSGKKIASVDKRLRPRRLRHRRHHGRPCARQPRLRLRPPLRPPHNTLIEGADVSEESFDAKEGRMINSCGPDLDLNGLEVKDAIARAKKYIEEAGIGRVKVNYRLPRRHFQPPALLGRAHTCATTPRAWPCPTTSSPSSSPEIDKYLPTESGEPPLEARQKLADARWLPTRAKHHARLRRFVGLLPPLHGPAQPRRSRVEGGK